jgi:dTDP-4-amino-4,6-dideoxygalactose transaminase
METVIHYPIPVHLKPAYRDRLKSRRSIETESIGNETMRLTMHPYSENGDLNAMRS